MGHDEFEHADTEGVDINTEICEILCEQLGWHVDVCALEMTHVAGRMCDSQVCDLRLKLIGEENVCWFDVEVGHVECFVDVLETMKATLDDINDLLGSDCFVFGAVSEDMEISLGEQLKVDEHLTLRDHSDHVLMEPDLEHGGCFEDFVVFESGME